MFYKNSTIINLCGLTKQNVTHQTLRVVYVYYRALRGKQCLLLLIMVKLLKPLLEIVL